MEKNIKEYSTAELIKELKNRQGVINTIKVPPYEKVEITTEGPAVILVVID